MPSRHWCVKCSCRECEVVNFWNPFFDPKASNFEMKFKEIVLKERNSFLEDEKTYNMAIK